MTDRQPERTPDPRRPTPAGIPRKDQRTYPDKQIRTGDTVTKDRRGGA